MKQKIRRRYLTAALALAIALVLVFPIYWMVMSAVLPTSVTMSRNPPLLPPLGEIRLTAFVEVFTRKPVFTWLFNSITVTGATMAVVILVSTMAGYSLSRYATRAQQAMGFVLLTSKMLPIVLMVIPLFILFSQIGLIESYAGLVIALSAAATPFAAWMLKGFFDSIPREMEQAAKIDGCNELQAFVHIILPIVRPGMAAVAAYVAIVTWADLVFSRTLMSRPEHWLINVGLQSFAGEYLVDWASLMAASTVSLLPMTILFFFLEPFLVKGMNQGALAN
jgi:multiple sugar transport system permease protein